MKHRFLLFTILLLVTAVTLPAQTNTKIRQLRNQREQLQKKMKKDEQQLRTTSRTVEKKLADLAVLNAQIDKQEKTIRDTQAQIDSLQRRINRLNTELKKLKRQLAEKKQNYKRSMIYLYKNHKSQNKLLFILSADNFTQMFRRYQYVREYAKYQRVQGMLIQKKEEEVKEVQQQLLQSKAAQSRALDKQEEAKTQLESKQTEQKKAVSQLQKQQKQIQSVIAKNKKEMAQLNSKIDYYVQKAIEEERKRREAEERKRREAEQTETSGSSSKDQKKSSKNEKSSKSQKAEPMPAYRESSKEYKLAQNFASNKGRLPVPVTGPYIISARYGSYSMKGLSGVRLDNKGINITTKGPASARSIFDGEVSMIFSFGGLMNVLVRHGSYISVYCNLSSVSVSKGQRVSTRQAIGSIARDGAGSYTLHFQLRKETTILNPESWIAK